MTIPHSAPVDAVCGSKDIGHGVGGIGLTMHEAAHEKMIVIKT
jgi:hypothetical protein